MNTSVRESFAKNRHVSNSKHDVVTCLVSDLVPKFFLHVNKHGAY